MVATNFQRAVDHVLASEGGYVDHPQDPGGATNLGITLATLAHYRGREVSKADIRALGLAEATAIYRLNYWSAVRADMLPGGVDFAVFDCAVNSGPRRAVLILQEALGVARDGIIGPATLEAAGTCDPASLISRYCALRLAFLDRLPTAKIFGNGWRKRVDNVQRHALALAASSAPDTPPSRPYSPEIQEMTSMINLRTILLSRPIWANLVGLASIMLSLAGLDTSGLDTAGFSESLLQVVAGGSFIASSLFQLRRRNT